MTHEELLKKIYSMELRYANEKPRREALRAVVKLHKPLSNKMQFCTECKSQYNNESDVVAWPCRTIQAIEKELQ